MSDDELHDTTGVSLGDDTVFDLMEITEAIEDGEWDETKQQELMEQVDFDSLYGDIQQFVMEYVRPHLDEIREEAQRRRAAGESRFDAREQLEQLSEEEKDQEFQEAANALIKIAVQIQGGESAEAMRELKGRIRNPWTMERLLLLFDHEEMPAEQSRILKETATVYVRGFSIFLLAPAYTFEERKETMLDFFSQEDVQMMLDAGRTR